MKRDWEALGVTVLLWAMLTIGLCVAALGEGPDPDGVNAESAQNDQQLPQLDPSVTPSPSVSPTPEPDDGPSDGTDREVVEDTGIECGAEQGLVDESGLDAYGNQEDPEGSRTDDTPSPTPSPSPSATDTP